MTTDLVVDECRNDARSPQRGEQGVAIILAAAVAVVLMGMAGFAVDLGWLYSQRTEAQKAAEAAALAGVVHMPIAASETFPTDRKSVV